MISFLSPPATRHWYHWLIAGLANIFLVTFAVVGLNAVVGGPLSTRESLHAGVGGAVAVQVFLWYLTWRGLRRDSS